MTQQEEKVLELDTIVQILVQNGKLDTGVVVNGGRDHQ
jgi:hypothetical protein